MPLFTSARRASRSRRRAPSSKALARSSVTRTSWRERSPPTSGPSPSSSSSCRSRLTLLGGRGGAGAAGCGGRIDDRSFGTRDCFDRPAPSSLVGAARLTSGLTSARCLPAAFAESGRGPGERGSALHATCGGFEDGRRGGCDVGTAGAGGRAGLGICESGKSVSVSGGGGGDLQAFCKSRDARRLGSQRSAPWPWSAPRAGPCSGVPTTTAGRGDPAPGRTP